MKLLNKWYSLFFIFPWQAYAGMPSMSMDLADSGSSAKRLHNTIASSVKNIPSAQSAKNIITPDDTKNAPAKNLLAQVASAPVEAKAVEAKSGEVKNDPSTSSGQAAQDELGAKSSDEKSGDDDKAEHGDAKSGEAIAKSETIKEPGVLYQEPGFIDNEESVVFNFEETDISNVASYMETIHKVKFITDDILTPMAKGGQGLSGHKITFRTNKVLTKKESWDLFITFLHIAGLDLVPMMQAGFYKIVPFAKALSEIVPTYIGVDVDTLPDNEMIVRYVYFTRNIDPAKLQKVLKNFQAGSAKLDVFSELRALIFHDRATNIKSLMQIVLEMDRAILPECLSVIKLKRANAADVVTLYKSLKTGGAGGAAASPQPHRAWAPGKKESSLEYFPKDVDIFHDARTNALILLGTDKSIKKIEEFVEKYIDVDISREAPPIFTYPLEYTNAADICTILTSAIQYGGTDAKKYGGVRDGVKFFSNMTIVPEPHSNSVIINSTKEDFEALVPLIKELDIPQKQIGLEVLIVQVTDSQAKALGAQISGPKGPDSPIAANQQAQTFLPNVSAQTSGIMGAASQSTAPVVTSTTAGNVTSYSIKASLGALLGSAYNGAVNEAGAILVTFGRPIWALFKVLQSMVSVHVVANPFVVVSNNTQAVIKIGEYRRILASQVVSALGATVSGTTPVESNLGFTITPQINKGNIINLQILVNNNQFIVAGSESSALQDQKSISTNASVANGEVLVLGGIMQEQYTSTSRGVPFLEHIPILGWFFKSKVKSMVKSHFLIFISPRLLEPVDKKENGIDAYTLYKMNEAQKQIDIMDEIDSFAAKKDPIQKAFFGESMPKSLSQLTGKEATITAAKKEKAAHKSRIYAARSVDRRKNAGIKDAKKNSKNKPLNNDPSGHVSFDDDFVHLPSSSQFVGKNSISNSMQQGGAYV